MTRKKKYKYKRKTHRQKREELLAQVKTTVTGPKPFHDEVVYQQVEMLAMLGATLDQVAEFFKLDVSTVGAYEQRDPHWAEAKARGSLVADSKVAATLYKRCLGYDFEEEELRYVGRKLKRIKVQRHVPPNVPAIIFWLKNRQRHLWFDFNKVQVSGQVDHYHAGLKELPLEDLSSQAQETIFEITQAQLAENASKSTN